MTDTWRRAIPQEDWDVYAKAGFGNSAALGTNPALLVIDVQFRTLGDRPLPLAESIQRYERTSCGENGWNTLDATKRMVSSARDKGVPVIYPHVAPKTPNDAGRSARKIPSLLEVDVHGYKFPSDIAPDAEDLLVPKRHPSAFFGTSLISHLIEHKIDTVLLAGCTTSGCVRATAVDATAYNLSCAVVEDCVYDRSWQSHSVSLFDIQAKYGEVIAIDQALDYLSGVDSRRHSHEL